MEYFITKLPFKYPDRREARQVWGTNYTHKGYLHCSIDFMMAFNENVYSIESGIVIDYVDDVVDSKFNKVVSGKTVGLSNIGNFITLKHTINDFTFYTSYFHLKNKSIPFKKNDLVKAGDLIGKVGRTGKIDGVHLHFHAGTEKVKWQAGYIGNAIYKNKVNYKNLLCSNSRTGKLYTDNHSHPQKGKWYLGSKFETVSANYDSQASFPKLVAGGESKEWWIKFKNTGDIAWENHNENNKVAKLALGTYSQPDMEEGRQFKCGWQSETRIANVEPEVVLPGQVGTFKFKVQAPEDISVEDSPFTLQVTPKTPDGWLRDDNGNELNCFAKISVTRNEKVDNANKMNQEVDDNYTEIKVEQSIIMCPSTHNENTILSNNIDNTKEGECVSNGDIWGASWVVTRCLFEDNIKIIISCEESISDGAVVDIEIFENSESILVDKEVSGKIVNHKCEILLKSDWIKFKEKKKIEKEFYFNATIQNGDPKPAQSNILYIDIPEFIVI